MKLPEWNEDKFLMETVFDKLPDAVKKRISNWKAFTIVVILLQSALPGLLTILLYGEWAYERPFTLITTNIMLIILLFSLIYLRHSYEATVSKLSDVIPHSDQKSISKDVFHPNLRPILVGIVVLITLGMLIYFYNVIWDDPSVVGNVEGNFNASNLGYWILAYYLFLGIFVATLIVDGVTISYRIARLPYKIKEYIEISTLSMDHCGGLSVIGQFLLKYCAVYYLVLTGWSIARSDFIQWYDIWFFFSIFFWSFGFIIFFTSQWPLHEKLKEKKDEELTRIYDSINSLKSTVFSEVNVDESDTGGESGVSSKKKPEDGIEQSLRLNNLLIIKNDIEKMNTFSFDFNTMSKFGILSFLSFVLQIGTMFVTGV